MPVRTYPDSNVLIGGGAGSPVYAQKVIDLLTDANREFFGSDWLKLEVLPKPTYNKQTLSVKFYENFLADCVEIVSFSQALVQNAFSIACKYGLSGFDALHVAAAIEAGADEFITLEKKTKPIFQVKEIKISYLLDI